MVVGGGGVFFSVLEQFEITKFSLGGVCCFVLGERVTLFIYKCYIVFRQYIFWRIEPKFYAAALRRLFQIIESFFHPTSYSTKNYMFGRIAAFVIKYYLNLFVKKKILIFFRSNAQIIKLRIQSKFQQVIKVNFGSHFPYYSRLLNYYPFLLVIFLLTVLHNFNGLLFYGLLIRLFYYKIL